MTDDVVGIVLIFLQEVIDARKSNLIDVFLDFFSSHSDALVANGDSTSSLIHLDVYGEIVCTAFKLSFSCQCFQFLRSIYCVRHHFA